jgi:hypothetical protein
MNDQIVVTCRSPRNGNVVAALAGTAPWRPFGDWSETSDLTTKEREVCARLLAAGGKYVLWPGHGDEDLPNYQERGKVFTPKRVSLMRGAPNGCHANAAANWSSNPGQHKIATGYALTKDDQMWRQHSFNVGPDNRIIETTVIRQLYFGYVLTDTEAIKFLFSNS